MHDADYLENLKSMNEKIQAIRTLAVSLESETLEFPALNRNLSRMQASLTMMELNLTDPLALAAP